MIINTYIFKVILKVKLHGRAGPVEKIFHYNHITLDQGSPTPGPRTSTSLLGTGLHSGR